MLFYRFSFFLGAERVTFTIVFNVIVIVFSVLINVFVVVVVLTAFNLNVLQVVFS